MKKSPFAIAILLGFLLAIGTAEHASAADLPAPVSPTERMDLFNGKDFTGWTFCFSNNVEPAMTFTVTNGVIHCTGQPFSYVRTDKSFRDYKLTVEWRFVKTAPRADNTGVFVHVQTPDKVFPMCYENQGQFHHHGDIILMGGAKSATHQGNGIQSERMKQPQNENAAGEWNTYEVVCKGDTITNYVNGKQMNQVAGCNLSSGAIALQSEGGEWEARKVFIEPLK
jgi:hypothetical protein